MFSILCFERSWTEIEFGANITLKTTYTCSCVFRMLVLYASICVVSVECAVCVYAILYLSFSNLVAISCVHLWCCFRVSSVGVAYNPMLEVSDLSLSKTCCISTKRAFMRLS